MLDQLPALLATNDFLAGGAALGLAGVVLHQLRRLPAMVIEFARRHLILTIEILDGDEAFGWVSRWLAVTDYGRCSRSLTVETRRDRDGDEVEQSRPQIILAPAPGSHLIRYQGRLAWMVRQRDEATVDSGSGSVAVSGYRQSYRFRFLSRDRSIAARFVEDIRDIAYPPSEKRVVMRVRTYQSWTTPKRLLPRSRETLVLEETLLDDILGDAAEFLRAREKYVSMGQPWRRSYLFHGPPGSGKSSLILVMASELDLPVYSLDMSMSDMTDNVLLKLLHDVQERSLVLLEDVDVLAAARHRKEETEDRSRLTTAGLLNALDGVASPQGVIYVMTTNYPDRLDRALLRPGRVDVSRELGNATPEMATRLYLRFNPGDAAGAERFASSVNGSTSMAKLQAELVAAGGRG